MMDTWVSYRIGDIAAVVGGSTPSTADPTNFDGGIPWLTPKDLSGQHDRYVSSGERTLSQKGLASCSAQLLPANTVLLSTRAPIGYVALAKNRIATNQGFRSLIPKPGFDPGFIYYWLTANVEELERHASGSTFPELSGSALKRIQIKVPPESEQRTTAHILGTLDNKIELNRRTNRTLEEIARALFTSWFVAFDPVRAKAAGQQPAGMDAAAAAQFPASLDSSTIGPVPTGWNVRPIGDAVRVVGGSTPSTARADYWGGKLAFCTPRDMAGLTSPVLLKTERHITAAGLATISSGTLPLGTVLLSSRAPIGYLAISAIDATINQGMIAMICDRGLSNHYVALWTKQNMDTIIGNANGTTFLEISKRNFRPIPVLVPTMPVLEVFERIVDPMYRRIEANEREIAVLTILRDSLLPRLLSGELRVPEAERLVAQEAV